MIAVYTIQPISPNDIDEVTWLMQANSPSQGGTLTGEFPRDKVEHMALNGSPVLVARRDGLLAGVLFTSSRSDPSLPPIIQAMLNAWPGSRDAYLYGPVCIAASERGRHLLEQMYQVLKRQCPAREAILFIRRDNLASIKAHLRLGMHDVASFSFQGHEYAVFSDAA